MKTSYYIDPVDLKDAIVEMQTLGRMTDRFARLLIKVQEHVLVFRRFVCYRDEVKQACRDYNISRWLTTGWKVIKPSGNPFAYMTQACYLNFLTALKRYFSKQLKHRDLMRDLYEIAGVEWHDDGYTEAELQEARHDED